MKKILLIKCLLLVLSVAQGQVLINLQIPGAGLNIKSQLWNMTLVNTETAPFEAKLDMVMSDVYTGQAILSGSSRLFMLATGTVQLQMNNLVPVQYNVLNSSYNIDASPDGFIPPGIYSICFSLLKKNGEVADKIAEECDVIEVEPAAPPFLNFPYDEAIVDEVRPLFTWTPPAPAFLYSSLTYEMKLVEVLVNQNAADAVQDNFPVFTQSYINLPRLQYPFSVQALDTGKIYAWQVKAFNNSLPAGTSEIFSFSLKNESNSPSPGNTVYSKLKNIDEIPFTVCTGILRYEYVNALRSDTLMLQLTDVTTNQNRPVSLDVEHQLLTYGQNFLTLDLLDNAAVKHGHIYQLIATTAKGDKKAIRFLYKKAN